MNWKQLLWSIFKWLLKLIGKLLLFAFWMTCELLSAIFTALAKYLKEKITSK